MIVIVVVIENFRLHIVIVIQAKARNFSNPVLNLVFIKSTNLNLNVSIKHSTNLIFSKQNLHCKRSNVYAGQKNSESDHNTINCLKLACVLLLCLFSFIYLFFLIKIMSLYMWCCRIR